MIYDLIDFKNRVVAWLGEKFRALDAWFMETYRDDDDYDGTGRNG